MESRKYYDDPDSLLDHSSNSILAKSHAAEMPSAESTKLRPQVSEDVHAKLLQTAGSPISQMNQNAG